MFIIKDFSKIEVNEISIIAQAWIERYEKMVAYGKDLVFQRNDLNSWVNDLMDDLVHQCPDKVFLVIDEVLLKSDNDDVLCNLAAGPLENLLRFYGGGIMSQIESRTRNNSKFRELIPLMYQVTSDELWEKIMALSDYVRSDD